MNRLISVFSWLVTLTIPLLLLMTSIRLLLNPLFLEIEYRTPNFPADPYGFTFEERLKWSKISLEYLLNDAGIDFLAELKFADGSPLYIDRELSHMLDVKILVQQMIVGWYVVLALLVVIALIAWQVKGLPDFWTAVTRGGWLTLGLIAAILLSIAVSFSALFTGFHRIFFEGESWIFLYSDTLIRLFPLRFWQDAFIILGVFTIIQALVFIYIGRRFASKAG